MQKARVRNFWQSKPTRMFELTSGRLAHNPSYTKHSLIKSSMESMLPRDTVLIPHICSSDTNDALRG